MTGDSLPSKKKKPLWDFQWTTQLVASRKTGERGRPFLDVRHTLIGNSWHVPVIAWLLQQLCWPLSLTEHGTLADLVRSASPGGDIADSHLPGFLRRPPLRPVRTAEAKIPEEVLTKKLVNLVFVSIKGEDLLLQSGSEITVKFHRLRASVPGRLRK